MTFVEQSLASAILPHIIATGHAADGTVASARGPVFSGQNAAACRAAAGDAARGSIAFTRAIDRRRSVGWVGSAGAAPWSAGAVVFHRPGGHALAALRWAGRFSRRPCPRRLFSGAVRGSILRPHAAVV